MVGKIKKVAKVCAGLAIGVSLLMAAGCTGGLQDQISAQNEQIAGLQTQLTDAGYDLELTKGMNKDLTAQNGVLGAKLASLKLELDEKDQELLAYEQEQADQEDLEVQTAVARDDHVLDDISLWEEVVETLSDREVSKLFDGEVEFDGEDYDVEEVFKLDGVKIVSNEEDMASNTYLTLSEGALSYGLVFDGALDLSDISEDETLTLTFLGQDIVISEWDEGQVTLTKGTEYGVTEGESVTLGNVEVKLDVAGDGWVYVTVGDDSAKIEEGETDEVGGMEVRVVEVVESVSWRKGFATLELGEDVEVTVEDGDEYAKGSAWEWVVDDHYLGLVLAENYVDVDADEEYRALAVSGTVSLPNDWLTLEYTGLEDVDYEDYSFKLNMKGGEQYVEVKGKFTFGLKDYEKIYANEDGFYDKDLELISEDGIGLDNSDMSMELGEGELVILLDGEVMVRTNLALDALEVEGEDLAERDDDWLSEFGIVVKSPEDQLDDNKIKLSAPEKKVTGLLTIY